MKKGIFLDRAPPKGANLTSDAESGHLRGDDSSDSSVPATQRAVSSRRDDIAQQKEETRRHGDRYLDKERQKATRVKE